MEFANQKSRALKFCIIVRNNLNMKTKSIRFDNNIKNETKLLNLIKKLLQEHYSKLKLDEGLNGND